MKKRNRKQKCTLHRGHVYSQSIKVQPVISTITLLSRPIFILRLSLFCSFLYSSAEQHHERWRWGGTDRLCGCRFVCCSVYISVLPFVSELMLRTYWRVMPWRTAGDMTPRGENEKATSCYIHLACPDPHLDLGSEARKKNEKEKKKGKKRKKE